MIIRLSRITSRLLNSACHHCLKSVWDTLFCFAAAWSPSALAGMLTENGCMCVCDFFSVSHVTIVPERVELTTYVRVVNRTDLHACIYASQRIARWNCMHRYHLALVLCVEDFVCGCSILCCMWCRSWSYCLGLRTRRHFIVRRTQPVWSCALTRPVKSRHVSIHVFLLTFLHVRHLEVDDFVCSFY